MESNIFDVVKDNVEIRKIDSVYLIGNEHADSKNFVESIIFEINNKFWIITVNNDFDEVELKILPHLMEDFSPERCLDNLSNLKGLEIGTMFAIINERGYTDGIKLSLYNHSEPENNPFFAVLTIVALASGLHYELRQTGIDTYLI
ncbi:MULTISPECIES: DUF6334 family protein [Acinetobacter]|uniref:Uncharacterized protein n=5 Tax=Gammaproteobacteria TaxID=1236 RepID=N9DGL0_9GAMM|nr:MULTISPECIES: DUF6334 family protein [Acinetobacter]ENV79613.1 hypothetical protein F942_01657 [Acinetobacter ursingii ANC 3649]MEC6126838.1 DUF6334 family protein [Acinetobacter ursingii]